jgi:hypothetical protein
MQEEEASMDPWSMFFLYGMKAPMTGEKYMGKDGQIF